MADVYAHEEQQERRALVQRSYQALKRWFMSNDKLQGKYGKLPSFWQEFVGWEHERNVWKRYVAQQDGVELPFSDTEDDAAATVKPGAAEPSIDVQAADPEAEAGVTVSSGPAVSGSAPIAGKKRRRFGAPSFAPTDETPATASEAPGADGLGSMPADATHSAELSEFAKAGMAAAAVLKLKKPKRRRFAEKDEFDQTLDKLTDFAKSNRFQQLALGPAGVLEIQEEVNRICGEGGLHAFLLRATAKQGSSSNPALQALRGLLGEGDTPTSAGPISDKATRKQQIQQELSRLNDQLNDIPSTIKILRAQPNRPPSPQPEYDEQGKRTNTLELRLAAEINDQKSVLIEELLDCDPALQRMKAAGIIAGPSKREKPSRKLYIPLKEHPEFNFMGVIIGPRGVNQKRLETETGCRISVRGRGTERPGKPIDKESINDDMHVFIQGDNERQVEAAAEKVAKLLIPRYDEEWKEEQMKQVAIINGTYKKTSIVALELPKMNYNMASELEKILDTVGEGAAKQEAKLRYGRQTAGLDAIPDDDDGEDVDGYKAYLQHVNSSQGLAVPPAASAAGPDAANGASKTAPLANASVVAAAPALSATAPVQPVLPFVAATSQPVAAAPAAPAVWTMPSLDEQRKAKETATTGSGAGTNTAAALHTSAAASVPVATMAFSAPMAPHYATSGAMSCPSSSAYPAAGSMPVSTGYAPQHTSGYAAQAPMPHMGMGMYNQYTGGAMPGYGFPQHGMPPQGMYGGGFAQPGFGMAPSAQPGFGMAPSALQQSAMGRGMGMQAPFMGQYPGMQGYGMPGAYGQQPAWPAQGAVGAAPPPPPPPPPPPQ